MKRLCCILLCVLLLCGCGAQEEAVDEPVEPDLTEKFTEGTLFGIDFTSIGPMCGMELSDDVVKFHPYYNSSEHIEVKKILLSDRGFWNTITSSYTDAVLSDFKDFELLTLTSGTTYGYMVIDEHWALFFKTDSLPSSYVKAMCDKLCKSDT